MRLLSSAKSKSKSLGSDKIKTVLFFLLSSNISGQQYTDDLGAEFHKKKRGERFMWLSSAIQLVWNVRKLGLDKYMTEIDCKKILKKEIIELKNIIESLS